MFHGVISLIVVEVVNTDILPMDINGVTNQLIRYKMNRSEAKDLLPIIQAFAEGKTIQSRFINGSNTWWDDNNLSFGDGVEYRIKPEPKYRPFKNKEECWQEMQKHQPFGWVKTDEGYEQVWHVNKGDDFNATFKTCTFADGTPFGIKEE